MVSKDTLTIPQLRKILVKSPFCGLKGFCSFSLSSVLLLNYYSHIYIRKKFYKKPIINDLVEGKEVAMLHLRDNVVPFLEVVTMAALMIFLPQNLYLISLLKSPFGCMILMSAICFFLRIFEFRDCCVDTIIDQDRPYIYDDFLLLSSWKEKRKLLSSILIKNNAQTATTCCSINNTVQSQDQLAQYIFIEKSILNRIITLKDLKDSKYKKMDFKELKTHVETEKINYQHNSSDNSVCSLSYSFALFPIKFFFSSLQLPSSFALCLINILELTILFPHDLIFDRKKMLLSKTTTADIADLSKDCAKSFVNIISLGILSLRINPSPQLSNSRNSKSVIQIINSTHEHSSERR